MSKCSWCGGHGYLIHERSWMQDGVIKRSSEEHICPICKGIKIQPKEKLKINKLKKK